MIVAPSLQRRERRLIQQAEYADAGSRADVNAGAGNGGGDELVAGPEEITHARLICVEELDRQVRGCIGVQSRSRCISRRPQNAISGAICRDAGSRSWVNK